MLAACLGKAWNKSVYLRHPAILHNQMLNRCKFVYFSIFWSFCKKRWNPYVPSFSEFLVTLPIRDFCFSLHQFPYKWAKEKFILTIVVQPWIITLAPECLFRYRSPVQFYSLLSKWTKQTLAPLHYRKIWKTKQKINY